MHFDKKIFLKQLFNITNNTNTDPADAVLMLELGEQYCCIAIVKKDSFEAQRLLYYEGNRDEQLLDNVIAAHSELKDHYSDVLISYSFPQSIMTPSKFYSYEDGKKMLQLLYGDGKDVSVIAEHLPEWHLYNVYEVPRNIHLWVSMQFHSGKYWHNYSSALKEFAENETANALLVDFKTGQFSVVVIKEGNLQLVQTFVYTETEDVLYYLLKICDSFSLSRKEVSLILSGLIDRQSALYNKLYDYFVHVSFKQNSASVKLSSAFDQYPAHFFSSLFNLASCVS